jgi:hypothetical protein
MARPRRWLLLASMAAALPISRAMASEEAKPAPQPFDAAKRFAALVKEAPDLEYEDLLARLSLKPTAAKLSFVPSKARYYPEVERALGLAAGEKQALDTFGLAMVDHGNKLSMGQAYLEIYRADLPVFVTTDSILHALHRSYDEILRQIEEESLFSNLDMALAKLQTALCELPKTSASRANISDLNVAVAVARKLLEPGRKEGEEAVPATACGDDATIAAILKKVAALVPDSPDGPGTSLSGRKRAVDWSQFKPRGHYTKTPRLQAYFRAMMWLGRADIAWRVEKDRELRDAALLMLLASKAEQKARLAEMSRLIDFFVGRSDSLGPEGMEEALAAAGVQSLEHLFQSAALARLRAEVAKRPEAMQQIRSEVVDADRGSSRETPLSMAFQLFGQRFVVDSFVLSKVVFDAVVFHGRKQERRMPRGLDVMAAMGADQAVLELEPEIRKWSYASNLLAARRLLDEMPDSEWQLGAYNRWLQALRILQREPEGKFLPEVMRTAAWRRKQLQTGLASWAELRHDTILYAKQSMTAHAICEYPEGYVEPYPRFYEALAQLARQAMRRFGGPVLGTAIAKDGKSQHWGAAVAVEAFFGRFAKTMDRLAAIASKELSATPLDADEKQFLKHVIEQKVSVGCVVTTYLTGWYTQLIYRGDPVKREPTVADVHTDPDSGTVLEAGVGDVRYLVVAVDNDKDRALYVGPAYSYYELTSSTRLTDEEWEPKIESTPTPDFVKDFTGGPVPRKMTTPQKQE